MGRAATGTALVAAALVGASAAATLHRWSPPPSADVARGTEEAFAEGLHRRELPPRQAPLRWTTDRVTFAFDRLPTGEAELEVALAGHHGPVIVAADGVIVGVLPRGSTDGRFPLTSTGRRSRTVQLEVPVFVGGDGRRLGARLQRVSVRPRDRGAPGLALLALFAAPAVLAAAVGRRSGLRPCAALAFGCVVTAVHAGILWPSGLVRSPYAARLSILIAVGLIAAALFASWVERRSSGAGRWALIAMTAVWLVQGLLATSPMMIVSDAVFHANILARVAGGELFPTSVTQHATPFRFPYGVSFYAALAPLLRAGIDGVALVRVGAAVAGVLASAALFLVLLRGYGAAAAGLAVVLLQTLPATFDVAYSYGNLSNAFGQSATVGFFAWWAGAAPGGWAAGAFLLATAALAHFSSLIVAVALVAALAVGRRHDIGRDRVRRAALVAGLAVAAAYYAHHVGLMVSQLPRLLEAGGRGTAEAPGVLAGARDQVAGAALGWGLAAIALAWFGRPSWRNGTGIDRDLAWWWIGAGVLALPAIVSPLEVRYLYALAPALAAAAGRGAIALHARGGFRRALAWALVAVQAVTGSLNLAEAVFVRYRP